VQAWVHFVPIQVDYSDLHDILTFVSERQQVRGTRCQHLIVGYCLPPQFRGDIYGRGGQGALAEEIANAGLDWSEKHWRRVDMAAYTARLYLEWARLLSPDGGQSDFEYHEGMDAAGTM
jgi:hypothetical protein